MNFITRFPRTFLTLVAIVALLPGIFELPLMDRDEPRFSHATIEMMDRNDWVVPYFNDEYRFDKPPLTYWWMRLHYTMFGKHEFAARLHSSLSAWLIALLVFAIGGRIGLNVERSALAGAMWLCSFQVLIHGRMAVADMPLILFLVLSQWSQWEMLQKRDGKVFGQWFWIFHLSTALGFLAKGPLAYAIPLLTLLLYTITAILSQSRECMACYKTIGCTLLGVPLSLGIVALWGVPAMLQTDYQYFDVGIGTHVVERATTSMNNRKVVYWIYLVYMFPFLLPWSSQLTRTVHAGMADTIRPEVGRYLLSWFVSSFCIFSFMKTQLPHYILPGYPAFMLLLAHLVGVHYQPRMVGRILGRAVCLVSLVLAFVLLFACSLCPTVGEVAPMKGLFGALAALMFFLSLAAFVVYCNRPASGWQAIFLTLLASLCMIPAGHYARKAHATVRLMEHLSPDRATKRAAWKYQEGSLIWYPSDFWILGNPDQNPEFAEADEMVFQVKRWRVDDQFIDDVLAKVAPRPVDDYTERVNAYLEKFEVQEVARLQGWNPGSSSWVELIVAKRSSEPSSQDSVTTP